MRPIMEIGLKMTGQDMFYNKGVHLNVFYRRKSKKNL